jgi:hypothetical protein
VTVKHTGSGYNASIKPNLWSPANLLWVDEQNRASSSSIVTDTGTLCRSSMELPLGVAMWRTMAVALGWPTASIGWKDIANLASLSQGWTSKGHAEWGTLKFGHGHPAFSNSGRLSLVAEIYAFANNNRTAPITVSCLLSNFLLCSLYSFRLPATYPFAGSRGLLQPDQDVDW